jgi:glycosyltransferase involved in cell wall biosynthesis
MIYQSYVLFTQIDIVKNQSGHIYVDPLWAKDLKLHLDYIDDFRLCCPLVNSNNVTGLVDITEYKIRDIYILRKDEGLLSLFRNQLPNFFRIIKACKNASIVHSGSWDWGSPLSLYLLLLKPFITFKWIILIESSSWMLEKDENKTIFKIINHFAHKWILTNCVRRADARIFTNSFYRDYFLKNDTEHTLIAPASWIEENNLASVEEVTQRYFDKKDNILDLIFVARLIEDKGVFTLIQAIKLLEEMHISVNITLMGSGPLKKECMEFSSKEHGNVKIKYREPVDYGRKFFEFLRKYDIVIVPNLKQEQPRIVFDAFSQGLGVVASDTNGLRDIIFEGQNAAIFKRGVSQDLARAICFLTKNPNLTLKMGLNGLNYAKLKTHTRMHMDREKFLKQVFGF